MNPRDSQGKNEPKSGSPGSAHPSPRTGLLSLTSFKLLGADIFISYRRRTARPYALSLRNQLEARGFLCYLDEALLPTGEQVEQYKKAARRSRMFVVVGSPEIFDSVHIPAELKAYNEGHRGWFSKRWRRVLPINIAGELDAVEAPTSKSRFEGTVWESLAGLVSEPESKLALDTGTPSKSVVDRIEQSYRLVRSAMLLLVGSLLLAGLIFASTYGAVRWSLRTVNQKLAAAQVQLNEVNTELDNANRDLSAANRDVKALTDERERVQGELVTTRSELDKANTDLDASRVEVGVAKTTAALASKDAAAKTRLAGEATRLAQTAERARNIAQGEADKQLKIATARRLANQSEAMHNDEPGLLPLSTLLSAESMSRYPTLEADRNLRRALTLLPRPVAQLTHTGETQPNEFNPLSAFSRDGKYLVVISGNEALVWLVSPDKPESVARLKHDDTVKSFIFSHGDAYIITTSEDKTVRVWKNWRDGKPEEISRLPHPAGVNDISISSRGTYLATSDDAYIAHVWKNWDSKQPEVVTSTEDKTSREEGRNTSGRREPRADEDARVSRVAFSPDEKYLVTQDDGNQPELTVWEVPSGKKFSAEKIKGRISPDKRFLFSRNEDGAVRVAELPGVEKTSDKIVIKSSDTIFSLSELSGGDINFEAGLMATARTKNSVEKTEIILRDIASGEVVSVITLDTYIEGIGFAPGGKLLAVMTTDDLVRVWETGGSGNEVLRLTDIERMIGFSEDGNYVAGVSDDKVRVWATTPVSSEVRRLNFNWAVETFAVSPEGQHIVVVAAPEVIILKADGGEVARLVGNGSTAFSMDGEYLALATNTSTDIYTNWKTEPRRVARIDHHGYYLKTAAAFSPDSEYLAITGLKQDVQVLRRDQWDSKNPRPVSRIPYDSNAIVFDATGRFLITAGNDGKVRFWERWNTNSPRQMTGLTIEAGGAGLSSPQALAISPDGRYLAAATPQNIYLWESWNDATKRKLVARTNGRGISAIAFSHDGRHIAGTGLDTGSIWETLSGTEIARVSLPDGAGGISFTSDSKHLITGSADKTMRFWLWRPGDIVEEACERLNLKLSDVDWEPYLGDEKPLVPCSQNPEPAETGATDLLK